MQIDLRKMVEWEKKGLTGLHFKTLIFFKVSWIHGFTAEQGPKDSYASSCMIVLWHDRLSFLSLERGQNISSNEDIGETLQENYWFT